MAGVPVAHVEAGLRSHDRANPWPEEDFRIAIDAEADLLFAPTQLNAANLRREGARGQVMVTGYSGIDALAGFPSSKAKSALSEAVEFAISRAYAVPLSPLGTIRCA